MPGYGRRGLFHERIPFEHGPGIGVSAAVPNGRAGSDCVERGAHHVGENQRGHVCPGCQAWKPPAWSPEQCFRTMLILAMPAPDFNNRSLSFW